MIQAGRIYNLNYHLSIQKSPEDRNPPLLLFTDTAKKPKNYKMNYKIFFCRFLRQKNAILHQFQNSLCTGSAEGVRKTGTTKGPTGIATQESAS